MGEMHKDRSQLLGSLKCERKIKGRIRLVDCRMGVFTVSWKPEVWKRGEKGNRLVDEFCSHGCRVSGASLLQETCSNIRISAHEIPLNEPSVKVQLDQTGWQYKTCSMLSNLCLGRLGL